MPGPRVPSHGLLTDGGRGFRRNRTHTTLKTNLQQIPGIGPVQLDASATGVELRIVGNVKTEVFAEGTIPVDTATVTLDWFPQPERQDYFYFNYSDETGYHCGWHRQQQDHVEGLDHFQEQDPEADEPRYERVEFDHSTPAGLLWEIIGSRLPEHLQDKYGPDQD